jgi:hypothetical protein
MYSLKLIAALLLGSLLVACGGSGSSGTSSSSSSVNSSAPQSSSSEQSVSSAQSSTAEESSSSAVSSDAEQSSSSDVSSVVSSSSEASSEESSSSSSAAIVNTPLPLYEDFDQVVDQAGFTSTGYKVLATLISDAQAPFYHHAGGNLTFADGQMTLVGGRFTLANTTPAVNTTADDSLAATTGEFDLSQAYRISFCVVAVSGSGALQVAVDNNGTSPEASVHGNPSRLFDQSIDSLAVGERVVIDSAVGTATSFIQLLTESSATVTIDDLWVGYQDDVSTEPAPQTCGEDGSSSSSESSASSSESSSSSSAESSSSEGSSSSVAAPDFDFEADVAGEVPGNSFGAVGGGVFVSADTARTGVQSVKMTRVATGINTQLRRTMTRTETGNYKVSVFVPENLAQDIFLSLYDGSNTSSLLSIDLILKSNGTMRNRANGTQEIVVDPVTTNNATYTLGAWNDFEFAWADILVSRGYTLTVNGESLGVLTNHASGNAPERLEIKYGITAGAIDLDASIYVDSISGF